MAEKKIGLVEFGVRSCGNTACIAVLLVGGLSARLVEWFTFKIISGIVLITGADIDQDRLTPHTERSQPWKTSGVTPTYVPGTGVGTGPDQILAEDETLASSLEKPATAIGNHGDTIETHRAALIKKAHAIICSEFGCEKPELLAEDFQFIFPVVGPLTKPEFIKAFSKFEIRKAFPSAVGNFFNFCVDPLEPNRIWFMSRGWFKHTGPLNMGPSPLAPTGKEVFTPPQVLSLSFNSYGRVYKLTGGYVVDRTSGDSGGLGGMFGIFNALGKKLPFREGQPWHRSPEWEAFALRVPQLLKDYEKFRR